MNYFNGLTLFEMNRKPRTPVTEDNTTTIQIRNLNLELTCPVCLGILHNTMTVMECLHRFCAECISKSLRLGKKECPTCRVKCSSRRHLRPDPNFDAIINQIYPNLEEYEAKEETLIQEINKSLMQSKTLIESVEKGKKRQALAKTTRSRSKPNRKDKPETKDSKVDLKDKEYKGIKRTNGTKSKQEDFFERSTEEHPNKKSKWKDENKPKKQPNTANNADKEKEISFVLVCHPEEKRLAQLTNKYLRTSRQLTVRHLSKFLAKKFDEPDFRKFKIGIHQSPALSDETTLDVIDKQHWHKPDELTLYYKLE